MDEEKTRLQMEIERYREKCNHEREKCIEVQSKYQTAEEQLRRIDLPDDDAFSYTSTENGDSMIYQSNTPYGKDVLASMNLSGQGHC